MNAKITSIHDVEFNHAIDVISLNDTGSSQNFVSPKLFRSLKESIGTESLNIREERFEITVARNSYYDTYVFFDACVMLTDDKLKSFKLIASFIVFDSGEEMILSFNTLKRSSIFSVLSEIELFYKKNQMFTSEELYEDDKQYVPKLKSESSNISVLMSWTVLI